MNKLLSIILTLILLIFTNLSYASVIRVPTDYPTIQAAIDAAWGSATVLVADGTYTGEGNRDISITGKSITVKSENGAARCIIDCQGSEEEYHRGFIISRGLGTNRPIVDGFTIKNGYHDYGGGVSIHNDESSYPTIRNCIFINNNADEGGGVYIAFGPSSKLINCIFAHNEAVRGSAVYGFAFTFFSCTNCNFICNTSRYGGPVHTISWATGAYITNSIIWYNSSNYSDSHHVTYSNVQGGHPGIGNINKNPLFVDGEQPDCRLLPHSPCIDAGTDYNAPDYDFDDNPRPQGFAIDMGAYEYQGHSLLRRVHITMPSHSFFDGEIASCAAIVWNTENDTPPDTKLFVVLNILGNLYFAPRFSDFDYYSGSFRNGRTDIVILPEFIWRERDGGRYEAIWYAALTDPDITELWSEVGVFEFSFYK